MGELAAGVFESAPSASQADVAHSTVHSHTAAAQALIEAAAEQQLERSLDGSPKANTDRAREAENLIRTSIEAHASDDMKYSFESQPSKSTAAVRHGEQVGSESEYE